MTNSLLPALVGSQTPRVANFPPYPLSAAPEVIDLATACGLHLDEWQRLVLTHGLGQRVDEVWTALEVPRTGPAVEELNGAGAALAASFATDGVLLVQWNADRTWASELEFISQTPRPR